MEQTYIMIKPDAVQRGLIGEIVARIEKRGLKISAMKMGFMEEDKAKEHYKEHVERPFFGALMEYVTSGPCVSMVVEGKDAISIMRKMNGATNPVDALPGTIRGDFAIETGRNVVHASDSPEAAKREIAIHFSESEIVDYAKIDEVCLYE
ncbi:nucleoside-diphosphate kinase [Methanolobus zinderi]|jgi:nucleoside-diphosphate kinase|uniref:Nucleoside diphosphate kinase n=1 Tax=Methanolobus zinderi TaxID=536044 RepID=A0A7D5E8A8_9EURY|nr:nucleoside-diphosphate kinase [Methanolobus zinderi]KXS41452.1 MAG: nucleoside diphosphate kinase [Methanolobus sp. T82-4]QLC50259.1 nucleoside-diphosphate kinase [Methanolobus zinderi]